MLVDEYDKPLLGHLGNPTATDVQRVLKQFYAVVKTARDIFLFEFKLRGTAEEALRQIRDKQYAAGYRDDPRRVTLVGIAFDPEGRNLGTWLVEPA